jgi:hypothetical protein
VVSSHRYVDGSRTAAVARYESDGDIVSATAAVVPQDVGTAFAFLVLRLQGA